MDQATGRAARHDRRAVDRDRLVVLAIRRVHDDVGIAQRAADRVLVADVEANRPERAGPLEHTARHVPPGRGGPHRQLAAQQARQAGDEEPRHPATTLPWMLATGRVTELHRWPVKSMAGQPVDALQPGRARRGGRPRPCAVRRVQGRPAPARRCARSRACCCGTPATTAPSRSPDDVPYPELIAPDGRAYDWRDPELPQALEDDLGRPVALRRDLGLMQDLGHSLLVTTQATLDAVAASSARELDLRRFRTNVHVVLDAPAYAEEELGGPRADDRRRHVPAAAPVRALRDPDARPRHAQKFPELLRWLTREHRGLFGMNARPLNAARIAIGDPVSLR